MDTHNKVECTPFTCHPYLQSRCWICTMYILRVQNVDAGVAHICLAGNCHPDSSTILQALLFVYLPTLQKVSLFSCCSPTSEWTRVGGKWGGGGVECANREIFRDKLGIASAWALSVFKASPPKNRENSTLPSLLPTPPRLTTLLFKPLFLDIILQFCHQTLFTFPDY